MPVPLEIRLADAADAAAIAGIYAPYVEHTAVSFEYVPPAPEEMAERICRISGTYPYLTAWEDGTLTGYAYASPFHSRAAYHWCVETSIYVRTDHRRAGTGRALYQELERLLALQGVQNLNASIALPETEGDPYLTLDSVRFHERMGYHPVGTFRQCGYKFGRWYSLMWMEKQIGSHPSPPPPLLPLEEVLQAGGTE